MFEVWQIILIGTIFVIGGVVKGVVGMGLPTISLVLMTFIIDFKLAIIIVSGPAFVTNIWQAFRGGAFFAIWRRLWSYFLPAIATVWIGTSLLLSWSQQVSIATLGVITLIYAFINIAGFRMKVSTKNEFWSKPFVGGLNGVITGMTGTVMMPSAAYFQAIGFAKDVLVQALGIMFLLLALTLIIVFGQNEILITDHIEMIALCTLCAFSGLLFGQRIRSGLSEEKFRSVVLYILLLLGISLIFNSVLFPEASG